MEKTNTKQDMLFQFSNIDPKQVDDTKQKLDKLSVKYDDSNYYSPNSTHLIVGKISNSEKILCFIAAGKWILRMAYVEYSFHAKTLLNEKRFHISNKFQNSKLARVSLSWKEKIDTENIWPYSNWYVSCFIKKSDKLNAIIRIIECGHGKATVMSDETIIRKYLKKTFEGDGGEKDLFTLVIHDDDSKRVANAFSKFINVPCYPYQAIVDYLMQCQYSSSPVLPMSYYTDKENVRVEEDCSEANELFKRLILSDEIEDENREIEKHFLSSYQTYLLCASKTLNYQFVQPLFAFKFSDFWQNHSYSEGLEMLKHLNANELPVINQLNQLVQFILNFENIDPDIHHKSPDDMHFLYDSIESYLINLIINHPPIDTKLQRYYRKVFENLELGIACDLIIASSKNNPKYVIDILYIMSIHDYLVLNFDESQVPVPQEVCALMYCKINDDVIRKVRDALEKHENKNELKQLYKMFQIISLMQQYFKQTHETVKYMNYMDIILREFNNEKSLYEFLNRK